MKKKILISILLLLIIIAIIISIFSFNIINLNFNHKNNSKNNNNTNYSKITAEEAYNIIYVQKKDIIIIDVPTEGITRYEEAHLENAIMIHDENNLPEGLESLYDTKSDILIYDDDGTSIAIYYCDQLINHTYGKIYYLIDGFSEWKNQGYPYWTR